MQIVYKAFDGSEFKNENECLEYERGYGLGFLMYNLNEFTYILPESLIVFIDGECGFRKFEIYCKRNEYETKGINKEGVWVRSHYTDNFIFLNDGIIDRIGNFCNGTLGAYT